ncbi:FtsX-like permease family protein [Paenibacillus psychroresistens]
MDRMKEFAMLRAIGNTRWQIRKMIIGEGLIVGTSGILFGIIMGLGLSYLFAIAGMNCYLSNCILLRHGAQLN